jgi:SNF2 family DNA or RNA helicase
VRTHKDDVLGLPRRRFETIPVPLTSERDQIWFDDKSLKAKILSMRLRTAQRAKDFAKAKDLESQLKQLHSIVYQHATRMKRQTVLDYLLTLKDKAVVIGFHRDVLLDQLAAALRQHGRRVIEHNGDNTAKAAATVKAFQTDPKVQFFIGQLSVSNLSLTLTAASHVVFAELPQTRADLEQAMDRVHRFGQKKECVGTMCVLNYSTASDLGLLAALEHWKEVADTVLDGR